MNQSNHYVESIGYGPPVIFLPAGGFSGLEGLNIADHLKDEFSTYLMDLPGYGRGRASYEKWDSYRLAIWLKTYLDNQELDKVHLIGHSLGGAIALSFAVHFPERVDKLILLDQGHKPFPRIPISEYGPFALAIPPLNTLVRLFGKPLLHRLEPIFNKNKELTKEEFDNQVERFCSLASVPDSFYVRRAMESAPVFTASALNLMCGYYNLNIVKLLKRVKTSTYLVYGTFENVNEKEFRNTEKRIRKLKNLPLPIQFRAVDGGHYVHWKDATLLVDIKTYLTAEESELTWKSSIG